MSSAARNTDQHKYKVLCPSHPDAILHSDMSTGDLICTTCGLVVGDRIVDPGAEWRNFADDSGGDRSRVGKAEDFFFQGNNLATMIGDATGSGGKDCNGNNKYAKYSGLSSKERTLKKAFADITDAADRMHISEMIVESAHGIYKEVSDRIQVRGRHKDAIGMACLFIACRMEKSPRSFQEICRYSCSSKKEVGRCFKEIIRLLGLKDTTDGQEMEFVERFCSLLELPTTVKKLATGISRKASEKDIFPGKGLDVICGTAVLVASILCKQEKSIGEVTVVSSTNRHAIRTAYQTMRNNIDLLVEKDAGVDTTVLPVVDRVAQ